MVVASRFGWGRREAVALCAAGRRADRVVVEALRFSGEVTTTDGSDCGVEPELDCANVACGQNTNTETVADAATRNTSRDFKASPQPASTCRAFRKLGSATPVGTHNARDDDSSNGKALRVTLRKPRGMNAKNCRSSQQHAIDEEPVQFGEAGFVVMRSSSKSCGPPHQASSGTRSELPDWIKQSRSSCYDRSEYSRLFLVLLRPFRTRRSNKAGDRLGAFPPLAGHGLRLETRFDRDSRRGVGRRGRSLGQACRRNDPASQHRGTRSH